MGCRVVTRGYRAAVGTTYLIPAYVNVPGAEVDGILGVRPIGGWHPQHLVDNKIGARTKPKELAEKLRLEFDELFSTQTKYAALDDRIAKTAAKKDELLTVLSLPEVPLHNNASELGARVSARRRDVSLHSRSERGVRAMDIFTTLVQTSKKLGISAFAYLRDRLSRSLEMPSLAQSIRHHANPGPASG